jgi:hypothetical protein
MCIFSIPAIPLCSKCIPYPSPHDLVPGWYSALEGRNWTSPFASLNNAISRSNQIATIYSSKHVIRHIFHDAFVEIFKCIGSTNSACILCVTKQLSSLDVQAFLMF